MRKAARLSGLGGLGLALRALSAGVRLRRRGLRFRALDPKVGRSIVHL